MSRGLNKAVLIGRVGARPQVRTAGSGTRVATFSVATHRRVPGGERTDWHQVVAWDEWARLAERELEPGDRVYVEGRLEYREVRKRGRRRTVAEVIVEDLKVIEERARGAQ